MGGGDWEGIKKQMILSVMNEMRNGSLRMWLNLPRWSVRKNSDLIVFGGEEIQSEGWYKEAKSLITGGSRKTVSRVDQSKNSCVQETQSFMYTGIFPADPTLFTQMLWSWALVCRELRRALLWGTFALGLAGEATYTDSCLFHRSKNILCLHTILYCWASPSSILLKSPRCSLRTLNWIIICFKEKRKEIENTSNSKIYKIKLPQDTSTSVVRKKLKGSHGVGLRV